MTITATTFVRERADAESRSPERRSTERPPRVRPSRVARWVSYALAAVVVATTVVMMLAPDVLRGPAAMNGSARGTALVAGVLMVPVLVVSVVAAGRGSVLALLTWTGALGALAYNVVLLLFLTPINALFLAYVAWLGLAAWSLGLVVARLDAASLAGRFGRSVPRRGIAVFIWVIAGLNALAWLGRIVPALVGGDPGSLVDGTGVATNALYIQDLALWLPLMAVAGAWLWRGRAWGYVLAAAGLAMWVLESVTIAADQAYGAAADPTSSLVSVQMTVAFGAFALINLGALGLLLRGFDGTGLIAKARRLAPSRQHGGWPARVLSILAGVTGASAVLGGVALIRTGFGLSTAALAGTPFTSWVVPGGLLVATVALPQLVLAWLAARTSPWRRLAGLVGGAALVAWIVVQLLVLQEFTVLQPAMIAVGIAEMWLADRSSLRADVATSGQAVTPRRSTPVV